MNERCIMSGRLHKERHQTGPQNTMVTKCVTDTPKCERFVNTEREL